MKLISLKLLNYRRFRQEEMYFQDDLSLIFGKNGAGKSSVLDAIGYALFGPEKDFVRVKTEFLRSHFVREREPSKVELTFQYGLQTYRVVRVIDAGVKKFASEFIAENKDTLVGENLEIIGGGEVSSEIVKIIGVDRKTFLRSVFAQQKDLEVLSGDAKERKQLIHSILGLDTIEQLVFDTKRHQKEKNDLFKLYKSRVQDFDLASLEKNIAESKTNILSHQTTLAPLVEEKKQKQEAFETVKKDFGALQEKKEKLFQEKNLLVSLQNGLLTSQKNLQEYSEYLEKISQKEKEIIKFAGVSEKEQNLQKKLQELTLQKEKSIQKEKYLSEQKNLSFEQEKYSQELQQYSQKNFDEISQKILQNITELEQQNLSSSTQITTLETELLQLTKEANELKEEMQNMTQLGADSSCPTCKRPLQEHYPKLMELFEKSLQEKRGNYKEKIEKKAELQKHLEAGIQQLKDLKMQEKSLQNEKNIFIEIQTKFQNISQNLVNISQKLEELSDVKYDEKLFQETLSFHNQAKKEVQIFQELSGEIKNKPLFEQKIISTSQEIEKIKIMIGEKENEIKNIDFDEQKFNEKKSEYDNFYQVLEGLSLNISRIQDLLKQEEFRLLTFQKELQNFEEEKAKQQSLLQEVEYLVLKEKILLQYISHLLMYLKPGIEQLMSSYFSQITDGKYAQIELDNEYNIHIDGKTIQLYSGGEQDLANLCFRLSLGQNLSQRRGNPINFLVLDEVLGSQDKERQQNILIRLKKLEHKFSQILLISHVDEIKEFATNLIEIQSINREESTVVNY